MPGIKSKAIGNLGRDPEWREFDGGGRILQMNVACTERFKKRNGEKDERTEWVTVILHEKLGAAVEKYISKGTMVHAYGTLKSRAYINKKTGEPAAALEIRADEFEILGGRKDGDGAQRQPRNGYDDAIPGFADSDDAADSLPF